MKASGIRRGPLGPLGPLWGPLGPQILCYGCSINSKTCPTCACWHLGGPKWLKNCDSEPRTPMVRACMHMCVHAHAYACTCICMWKWDVMASLHKKLFVHSHQRDTDVSAELNNATSFKKGSELPCAENLHAELTHSLNLHLQAQVIVISMH